MEHQELADKIMNAWEAVEGVFPFDEAGLGSLAAVAAKVALECGYAHPHRNSLRCHLEQGHPEKHRDEVLGVEWTNGGLGVVATTHDELGEIHLLPNPGDPTPDSIQNGVAGAGYAQVLQAITGAMTACQATNQAYRSKRGWNAALAKSCEHAAEACAAALDTLRTTT